ncbi:uncharacterized protein LOC118408825 [Branchiostoma floridae]|uniref:Uncharacterized protein LOC118408825 n=1 Tax=Branchiostoma floridae TaxID=7739 RepID=A0A9J7KL72_BRAFL|nr:uncharacterized protein LOC118408825 [Branchiostoma floridae]
MSQLYQEVGRAGRSGQPATAVVLAGKTETPAEEGLQKFVAGDSCIRTAMLESLGSRPATSDNCCSYCQEEREANEGAYMLHPRQVIVQKQRAAKKRKRLDGDAEHLETNLRSLRNELFMNDSALKHVGPQGVLSDNAINKIKAAARSVHTVEDLCKKVKGVRQHIAPRILELIAADFPEPEPPARRRRGPRRPLEDITNAN